MAGQASLQAIGNWEKMVGFPLRDAMGVFIDVTGSTGEKACAKAIVFMAQAASKLVRVRRKNRAIKRDEHGKYVEVWKQGRATYYKVYDWMFDDENMQNRIPGTWEDAKKIGSAGLASRSWMWGLRRLGAKGKVSTAIPGTARLSKISRPTVSGYVKTNKLSYIMAAMRKKAPGWERAVEHSAGNRIMAIARKKIERQAKTDIARQRRSMTRGVQGFFKAVA